jgi:RNA polymerase sigma-70 factor (ECF subfamily)
VAGRDWWSAAVTGLPDLYRAPVVLRHVQGLSYEEAAEALGRPVGTVKAQVHRGLALLRAAVEQEEL